MSTTLTGAARLESIQGAVTLTAMEWGQISCLLSVHNQDPVMPPASTAVLNRALDRIEQQLGEIAWEEVANG